jgi:hypothetical protein
MKFNRSLAVASLLATLITPVLASAEVMSVKANLLASSEVPPKDSQGHGLLDGTYDASSHVLQWKVTYSDLTGPASMAHFHGPAPVGENSGVMIPIDANNLASPIEGKATLTNIQARDLLAGNWYFNIHTLKYPGGEIRGQVAATK